MNSFTVHDLPVEERPRERFARGEDVSGADLIAILLGRGMSGLSVLTLAQNLLKEFGSLEGVVNASLSELQGVRGLGPAKALQLKACLEIARKVIHDEAVEERRRNGSKAVADPKDIAEVVKPLIRNWEKEHFFVISFDNRNRILGVDLVGIGTLNSNLVHPRETFGVGIDRHAACIAVCHNHPSGDPTPSEADLSVTKRLKDAGELMGIQLLDHVVISKTDLCSFRESGLLG